VLPNITLPNNSGTDVEVGSLAKEQGVVFFLVPKANTRKCFVSVSCQLLTPTYSAGCTTQACGFRDTYQDFTGLDYAVFCVSADSPKVQTSWQTKVWTPNL
jgi:peroxiredoxin Q/BCP